MFQESHAFHTNICIKHLYDDMYQEITLTRRLVKLRDVKLATLVGDTKNAPVGYLQLSGFSTGAAQELRQAYRYLDSIAEGGLRGVILDLRGNPGEGKNTPIGEFEYFLSLLEPNFTFILALVCKKEVEFHRGQPIFSFTDYT